MNGQRYTKAKIEHHLNFPIVVHCHLCWDWVWQRPQQFLSRLSQRHRILFVETVGPDPQLASPVARFQPTPQYPNLTVLRVQFPTWRWADGAFVDQTRRQLVQEVVRWPLPHLPHGDPGMARVDSTTGARTALSARSFTKHHCPLPPSTGIQQCY